MMNCFFGFYRLHYTLQGVWRSSCLDLGMGWCWVQHLSVSAVSVVATLEIAYFKEKDTLALQDLITTKIWERNENNC